MLWSGLKALVRNAAVFAAFLGVDVAGQAVLVWAVPIESATRALWISSLALSLLLHLLCGAYLLCCAVEAGRGGSSRLSFRDAFVGGGARLVRVVATLVAVGIAVAVGLVVYTWVGVAVLLALGLVPLAAAGGARNPLRSGLVALARHAPGYAWVVIVGTAVFGAVAGAVALVALFWPTPLAQVVVMVGEGVVVLWLACSLAPAVVEAAER